MREKHSLKLAENQLTEDELQKLGKRATELRKQIKERACFEEKDQDIEQI
jgi:hypothetical protein